MELGKLRAAIRKMKGNPKATVLFAGKPMSFALMKGPLLEELEVQFPGGKTIETGISLNEETGELVAEQRDAVAELATAVAELAPVVAETVQAADQSSGLLLTDEPKQAEPAQSVSGLLV